MSDDNSFMHRLDERVDAMGERIATLEGKLMKEKPKDFRQYLSEYGGTVALVLSILIGTFTLYDKVIIQPQKERDTKSETFRKNLDALVQLSNQIASVDWTNPLVAQAQVQSLTPQKIALIEKIERYGEVHPEELKFTDLMMLANENEFYMRNDKALKHLQNALLMSVEPWQKSTVFWSIARIHGKSNKLQEMRVYYRKALEELKPVGLKMSAGPVMQIYNQWVYMELIQGDSCFQAAEVFKEMRALYSEPDVWPATRIQIRTAFQQMISQAPKTCDLALH